MRQYSLSPLFELPNAEEKRDHAYNRRMQEEVMSHMGHEPQLVQRATWRGNGHGWCGSKTSPSPPTSPPCICSSMNYHYLLLLLLLLAPSSPSSSSCSVACPKLRPLAPHKICWSSYSEAPPALDIRCSSKFRSASSVHTKTSRVSYSYMTHHEHQVSSNPHAWCGGPSSS